MCTFIHNIHSRVIILILCISIAYSLGSNANAQSNDAIDSMAQLLPFTTDVIERFDLLTNLSDLASGKKDISYSRQLWKESSRYLKSPNKNERISAEKAAAAASIKLIVYNLDNKTDSFDYYINWAHTNLEDVDAQRITTYYKMIKDARSLQGTDMEACKAIVSKNIKDIKESNASNDFEKMSQLYIIVAGLNRINLSNHLLPELENAPHINEEIAYAQQMLSIAEKIPIEKDFLFRLQALMLLSGFGDTVSVEYSTKLLHEYEQILQLPDIAKRPYYSQRVRIRCVGMLMISDLLDEKTTDEYFVQFNELLDKYPGQAPTPPAEYYRAMLSKEYYRRRGNLEAILACCDTLLFYNTYSLFSIETYLDKAETLGKLGRYKEGFDSYQKLVELKDSISEVETQKQYYELQNLYETNQVKLEKLEMHQKYQFFAICAGAIFLLIAFLWGLFYNRMSHRTKNLNKALIQQTEKAMESEKMKSSFMNSMCHEFRTPMNIITGYSSLIAFDDLDKEEKHNFQNEIEKQSEFLLDMMEDMLQIADMSNSVEKMKLEEVDISDIIKENVNRVKALPKNDITYKIVADQSSLNAQNRCIITTKANYVSSVIKNLLSNAKKFSKTGEITISYKLIGNKSLLEVSVSDQGCGIPKEKLDWVFGRFNKVDKYVQGAGLGLYTCRLMINQLNGKIWIDPEYTDGANIIFQIPAK